MKSARSESHGNVDFARKFCTIIIGTIGCTIMLGIAMAIPIAMIVIGVLFKNDCKAEYYIPIYLIVAGSFGILKTLSSLLQRCMNKNKENAEEENAKTNPFDSTLNCFLFAWFIAGNVWIYRTYNHWSPDPTVSNYCHPMLYYFAFWVTTATYIMMGAICCCTCCLGIGIAIFGRRGRP
ncbi:hypothetical protein CHS0354_005856 [Potamilus streckersoni]|uniref:Uncharacterized protein n=1 Tax=Potamilus streckersoni TaxID=2493646 RepID=A0AAE0TA64_9BIVA|nr:hypothetical protein CHS0354_005856 [Potamilus streckersoni]